MLTDAQKVAVRRYAGYQLEGSVRALVDPILYQTRGLITTLSVRLDTLTGDEEDVLTTLLIQLAKLEVGILGAADNMDTSIAGPYTANPRERQDREALFNSWRRKMCAFIGVQPGPGLGDGQARLIRA